MPWGRLPVVSMLVCVLFMPKAFPLEADLQPPWKWPASFQDMDVLFFHNASIGIQLAQDLRVRAFTRSPNGGYLPAESSGLVHLDDRLIGVNHRSLVDTRASAVADILQETSAPRVLRFHVALGDARSRPDSHDFVVTLNGLAPLGLRVTEDLFVDSFTSPGRDGTVSQAARARVIAIGDRIVALDGISLLDVPHAVALDALRRAFQPAPLEQLRCRAVPSQSQSHALLHHHPASPYCAYERLPQPWKPRTLTLRPAGLAAFVLDPWATSTEPIVNDTEPHQSSSSSLASSAGNLVGPTASQVVCGDFTCGFSSSAGVLRVLPRRDALAWRRTLQPTATETLPAATLTLPFVTGLFGGRLLCGPRPLAKPQPPDACSPITAPKRIRGTVVLVERGGCFFATKARHVQEAGGVAMLVGNDDGGPPVRMPPPGPEQGGGAEDVHIGIGMVAQALATRLAARAGDDGTFPGWWGVIGSHPDANRDVCSPAAQEAIASVQRAAHRRTLSRAGVGGGIPLRIRPVPLDGPGESNGRGEGTDSSSGSLATGETAAMDRHGRSQFARDSEIGAAAFLEFLWAQRQRDKKETERRGT